MYKAKKSRLLELIDILLKENAFDIQKSFMKIHPIRWVLLYIKKYFLFPLKAVQSPKAPRETFSVIKHE
jgi:hypothetical protein